MLYTYHRLLGFTYRSDDAADDVLYSIYISPFRLTTWRRTLHHGTRYALCSSNGIFLPLETPESFNTFTWRVVLTCFFTVNYQIWWSFLLQRLIHRLEIKLLLFLLYLTDAYRLDFPDTIIRKIINHLSGIGFAFFFDWTRKSFFYFLGKNSINSARWMITIRYAIFEMLTRSIAPVKVSTAYQGVHL